MKRLIVTITCFLLWLSPLLIYDPAIAQTESPSWTFENSIGRVYWNADGSQLAFSNAGSIKILDIASGEIKSVFTFEPDRAFNAPLLAWSPNSQYIAISYYEYDVGIGFLAIVDTSSGHIILEASPDYGASFVVFRPNGQTLAYTGGNYMGLQAYDGWVVLINVDTGEEKTLVKTATMGTSPYRLAWSHDGDRLAMQSGGSIHIYDVNTSQYVLTLSATSADDIEDVKWSLSGNTLATLTNNLRIWNLTTGQPLASFQSNANDIAWSEDSESLILTGSKSAEVVDANTGELLSIYQLPVDPPENVLVYWRSDAKVAAIVDENTLTLVETIQAPAPEAPVYTARIETLAAYDTRDLGTGEIYWSPNGDIVFSSTTTIAKLSQPEQAAHRLVIDGDEVDATAFSPDGKLLAFALSDPSSHSYSLQLWDVVRNEKIADLNGHHASIGKLLFSHDGRWLASGSSDTSVRVWDTQTGEQIAVLWGHSGWITGFAFSPDNQLLASIGDSTMRLWDIKTGEQLAVNSGFREYVTGGHRVTRVSFNPDGTKVIFRDAAFRDDWGANTVIWDIETRQNVWNFAGERKRVSSIYDLLYSPDGHYIVVTDLYSYIDLFELSTGAMVPTPVGEYRGGPIPYTFDESVPATWVAFSPDSKILATTQLGNAAPITEDFDYRTAIFEENTIWLLDTESGSLIRVLRGNSASPYRLLFSPDGTQLLSQALDGTVKLWDVATGEVLEMWSITPE